MRKKQHITHFDILQQLHAQGFEVDDHICSQYFEDFEHPLFNINFTIKLSICDFSSFSTCACAHWPHWSSGMSYGAERPCYLFRNPE